MKKVLFIYNIRNYALVFAFFVVAGSTFGMVGTKTVLATTHQVTCPEGTSHAPQSCTGDVWSFGANYWESTTPYFNDSGPWYISYTQDTGDTIRFGDIGSTDDVTFTSSQVAAPLGAALSGTFVIYLAAGGPVSVSDLCLTNVEGDCEGGGGGGGGGTGTTTTATTTTINDPNRDFFLGWVAFFASLVFIVWLFKKR